MKRCSLCGHVHTAAALAARAPKGELGEGVLLFDCGRGVCRNTFAIEAELLGALPWEAGWCPLSALDERDALPAARGAL